MKTNLYYYQAEVISVYDGDTIRANIDLGMRIWIKNEKFRLARINAPELRGKQRQAGLQSRDFLRRIILDKNIVIETIKDKKGKYGRYLAEIWIEREGNWLNINDLMVEKGYAIYQNY